MKRPSLQLPAKVRRIYTFREEQAYDPSTFDII